MRGNSQGAFPRAMSALTGVLPAAIAPYRGNPGRRATQGLDAYALSLYRLLYEFRRAVHNYRSFR